MTILKNINLDDVLFLDIETVRIQNDIKEGESLYDSWSYKMRYSRDAEKFDDKPIEDLFKEKAALYSEFAKIVCITIGRIKDNKCLLHTISNHDEGVLLAEFSDMLNGFYAKNSRTILSGHAIKGFDIPFIMRRCIVNGVSIPVLCDVAHLKPWELNTLDTLELWKGTGFYSASLINIAVALGLPSPKSDINGSETSDVYYTEEKGLERIVAYCERDVHTVCNIICKFIGRPFIDKSISEFKKDTTPSIQRQALGLKITSAEQKKLESTIHNLKDSEKIIAQEILKIKK